MAVVEVVMAIVVDVVAGIAAAEAWAAEVAHIASVAPAGKTPSAEATGVTTEADLASRPEPDVVAPDLAHLVELQLASG